MSLCDIAYKPHKHQVAFHSSGARVKLMSAGARSGKTFGGAFETVMRAIKQPGYHPKDIAEGKPYQVACGAPTFPMLRDIVIPEVMRLIPDQLIVDWKKSEYRLIIRAEGKGKFSHILFKNCEKPERWEGLQLYCVWLDEAAQMKRGIYDEARTRVRDRKGIILLTGTPKGKNWVYTDVYERSLTDKYAFCEIFPTSANPYFPAEELEEARATMPPRYFRRTYEASWEAFEGQL
jgi:hypothetical protein